MIEFTKKLQSQFDKMCATGKLFESALTGEQVVVASSATTKFRRGKKYQQAYFEIGNTNQKIASLLIEAESFKRNGNIGEANRRTELAGKFKADLRVEFDAEIYDLEYVLPQSSGLYNKTSRRSVL